MTSSTGQEAETKNICSSKESVHVVPGDVEWLQNNHLLTHLQERVTFNALDQPLTQKYLERSIVQHTNMAGADAQKSHLLQRHHFKFANAQANDIGRGLKEGPH